MNTKINTQRGPLENRTNGPTQASATNAKGSYSKHDTENNYKHSETRSQGRWKVPYKPIAASKQTENIDCPISKQQLREFMKPLKDLENDGFYAVFHLACDKLKTSQSSLH